MNINFNNYRNQKQAPAFGAKIPVKIFGEVSKPFAAEIQTGISQFPRPILNQIQKAGLVDDIRLSAKASDAYPDYPAFQKKLKQEYAPGAFAVWDDALTGGSMRVAPEGNNKMLETIGFYESPKLMFKADPANRGDAGHELTHKTVELFEKITGIKISSTKSFKDVVKADLTDLPERLKQNPKLHKKWGQEKINYLTQATQGNLKYTLEEIFAECGAANTTGTGSEVRAKAKLMEVFFPESYKYVQKYFYLLGKR